MRLFLSSQGFGNHADRLLKMMGHNKKVLFVDNAKDYLADSERTAHVAKKRLEFEHVGLQFEELDLRDYFGKKNDLAQRLDGVGLLFMSGGSTFILRRAMKYSGLDELIIDNLARDTFVYAGSSAGSCVAAPHLHGTEYGDPPDKIPAGYQDEVIWSGLGLVDFHIVPHYLSDWFGASAHQMEQYCKDHDVPYITLTDGQVYVVDGATRELLT